MLNAEEIFAGKREVLIELDGVRYRLAHHTPRETDFAEVRVGEK